MAKRCSIGKSCGATCIQRDKLCEIELPEKLASALTRIASRLYERNNTNTVLDTNEKGIKWLERNTSDLLLGGFKNSEVIGQLGQYGKASAPIWLIGLEGGAEDKHLLFGDRNASLDTVRERYKNLGYRVPGEKEGSERNENRRLDSNRLLYINGLRDHMNMNTAVQKKAEQMGFENRDMFWPIVAQVAAKPNVSVQEVLGKIKEAPEGLTVGEVKSWNRSPASYAMKGSKLAEKLNEKEIALFNVSDLVRPGTSTFPVKDFLQENGVDTKRFAGGVYSSDKAWYAASAKAKGPKIVDSIMANQPKLVYIAGTNKDGPQKELFNQVLDKAGVGSETIKITSKNVKGKDVNTEVTFGVIDHPSGFKTVVAWGMHLTGTTGSWTETEKALVNLVSQPPKSVGSTRLKLMEGGKPGTSVLLEAKSPKVTPAETRRKQANAVLKELRGETKVSSGMADWPVQKLQRAYDRAYDAEDRAKMNEIVQILRNKGVKVE